MADKVTHTISLQYGSQVPDPSHPSDLTPDGFLDAYNEFELGEYHFFETYDNEMQTFKGDILYEKNRVARIGIEFCLHIGNFEAATDADWEKWLFIYRFIRNPRRVIFFPQVGTGETIMGVDVFKLTQYLWDESNSSTLVLVDKPQFTFANRYVKDVILTLVLNNPLSIDQVNNL